MGMSLIAWIPFQPLVCRVSANDSSAGTTGPPGQVKICDDIANGPIGDHDQIEHAWREMNAISHPLAQSILGGTASGPVIATDQALSFWGGVDPATGLVIDIHHPLHGVCITGAILMMPSTRGSDRKSVV